MRPRQLSCGQLDCLALLPLGIEDFDLEVLETPFLLPGCFQSAIVLSQAPVAGIHGDLLGGWVRIYCAGPFCNRAAASIKL
jgi:hypothetical protein